MTLLLRSTSGQDDDRFYILLYYQIAHCNQAGKLGGGYYEHSEYPRH